MAKKGAKIGEGHVSIHADMDDFNRGLDQVEKKTQATVQKVSQEASIGVAAAIASIPLAIYSAMKAFTLGTALGRFYRDIRDAKILIQDLRREMSKPGDELFGKAQGERSSLVIDRLRQQIAEVGNAAGGVDELIGKQFAAGAKAIADEQRKAVDSIIEGGEGKKEEYFGNIKKAWTKLLDDPSFAFGNPFNGTTAYQAVLKDIGEAERAAIATANSAATERLKLLKEELEVQRAIAMNQQEMALFQRQESQRGMFNLGQTALDPTVLSRELGRVYSNGGRY